MYWCWSRHDNNDNDLKNLTISAAAHENSEVNDIINRPFTARFYVNETHITCHDNEELSERIVDGRAGVYCPASTSTLVLVRHFAYDNLNMALNM